jgi:hypothetical protein
MREVNLLGATGMVGQGVLRECLLDSEVQSVLAIGRNGTVQQHEKLREIIHNDLSDLSAIEAKPAGLCYAAAIASAAGNMKNGK